MQLNEQQQQQVEAIASLVTQSNSAAIRQGVELAAALGDQEVFAELLDGLAPLKIGKAHLPNFRRFPTPERATRFNTGAGNQAWHDLAMIHLLAASDLPVKAEVASIALGTPKRKLSNPTPTLWIDGLERLPALTHLDLHLSSADQDIDVRALARFPSLTHLRFRGGAMPGSIPSMKHLRDANAVQIKFEPGAEFPALQSVRGQIYSLTPLTPETMPNLAKVEARDSISLAGYASLDKLWCTRGHVQLVGCERVEHLRISADSFQAPDLRHVGLLDRVRGVDISQLETLREVKLNRTSKLTGGHFPMGTQLSDPKVVLWGPALTDFGNIGELPGMEILCMPRVKSPISLESLRHATDLRVLDIRNSPGITDLSPIAELPKLEIVVIEDPDRYDIPASIVDRVQSSWRPNRDAGSSSTYVTKQA